MADTIAFDALVRDRSPALLRTAYLLTGDSYLAEDLLQTALAKTYNNWGHLRDESAGEAYVRKVMATTYARWWRRRWNGERPTADLPESVGTDLYAAADDRDLLRRALAGLSRRQRTIIVLRFYEDRSEREVAELLGMQAGTVKSATSRALARMREIMALDGRPVPPTATGGAVAS